MYDIAVIGGGPAGLSAAIQARARNKSVLVVSGDDRDNPLYKTSRIDNYLGFYNVTGPELLERFRTHAGQMGVERRDGRVLNLLAVGGAYYLSIGSEVEQARAVVLATGVVRAKKYPGEAERWGGVLPGSIYHALKKLEGEGCIALAGVEQTGHRQKAVYRITEAGRNHLHTLIADALRASSALYPTTLYSALSLADKLSQAEVRLALEEQRRRLEAEYAALERGRAGNEGQEVPPLARITIDNMVDIVQRQRRCVEELLAAVGEAP